MGIIQYPTPPGCWNFFQFGHGAGWTRTPAVSFALGKCCNHIRIHLSPTPPSRRSWGICEEELGRAARFPAVGPDVFPLYFPPTFSFNAATVETAEKRGGLREGATPQNPRSLRAPLARSKRGTLFYNRKFANRQRCEIKSAHPRSESSSSALLVLEWNSFSSLLPLSLMFMFLLGFSAFSSLSYSKMWSLHLVFFCFFPLSSEGRGAVGKRGAARGNATSG